MILELRSERQLSLAPEEVGKSCAFVLLILTVFRSEVALGNVILD